jgi:hypothetical protein
MVGGAGAGAAAGVAVADRAQRTLGAAPPAASGDVWCKPVRYLGIVASMPLPVLRESMVRCPLHVAMHPTPASPISPLESMIHSSIHRMPKQSFTGHVGMYQQVSRDP